MTSITGPTPQPLQVSTSTIERPAVPHLPGPKEHGKLVDDVRINQDRLNGVQQLRAELGQLRGDLQKDLQQLREQGPKMPPHERKAIMERVDRGMAHARELENRIVAKDPKAQQMLGQLRQERAEVQKQIGGALQELHRLQANPLSNRAAIDKQLMLVNSLMARQHDIGVRTDTVLGLRSPPGDARADLVATRNELRDIARQLGQGNLPPQVRDKLEARFDHLSRQHAELEQKIVAGNPRAQGELKAARENMRALSEQASKVHMALHKLEHTGGSKAEIAQLRDTLLALEHKMHATSGHIDQILGLKNEPGPGPIKR